MIFCKYKCYIIGFCTTKETINKTNDNLQNKKIFANEVTDKGIISKIYKQHMELNIKKST